MSRPTCWHCGKQLQYVTRPGLARKVPAFVVHVDPIGNSHKLHLMCAETEGYKVGKTQHGEEKS